MYNCFRISLNYIHADKKSETIPFNLRNYIALKQLLDNNKVILHTNVLISIYYTNGVLLHSRKLIGDQPIYFNLENIIIAREKPASRGLCNFLAALFDQEMHSKCIGRRGLHMRNMALTHVTSS